MAITTSAPVRELVPACGERRVAVANLLPLLPLLPVLSVAGIPTSAAAAHWDVVPSVRARVSHSDNINLAAPHLAQADTAIELAPGLRVEADAGARGQLALAYSLQLAHYQRRPSRSQQQLDGAGQLALVSNWLYLDAGATVSRQAYSGFGARASDPLQDDANSATVQAWRASPYLQHDFRGLGTATLRYDLQRIRSGRLLAVDSEAIEARIAGERRSWHWQVAFTRRHLDDRALAPVTHSDAAVTLAHPLGNTVRASVTAGYEKSDYQARSGQPQGQHGQAGLNWAPSPRTHVAASIGRRYFGTTYGFDAAYRTRNMLWTLNYQEDISTMHAQLFRVAPAGVADFLFQLWADRIPDPVKRRRSIDAFLLLSQMLGSDGTVNFFSHRYYLQKSLRLAGVYSGVRSAVSVTVRRTGSTAQTSSAVDSMLTGPEELSLEDRTRQAQMQLGWNWRLNARSSLTAAGAHSRSQSLSTGRRDRNGIISLRLAQQLGRTVTAELSLRHSRHRSRSSHTDARFAVAAIAPALQGTASPPANAGAPAGGAHHYRENGISAAVSVAF